LAEGTLAIRLGVPHRPSWIEPSLCPMQHKCFGRWSNWLHGYKPS